MNKIATNHSPENRRFQSLSSRLSLWIIAFVSLITITVLAYNHHMSRDLLEKYVEQLAIKTTTSTVQDIETVLHAVSSNADSLAAIIPSPDITEEHIRQILEAFVKTNSEIFGMAVALEPGVLNKTTGDFSPYFYKKDKTIAYKDLSDETYQYKNWPWYKDTKTGNRSTWSEPYVDTGGGDVHMVTYSTPVHLEDGKTFAGVATADIQLSWLDEVIKNSKIGKSGYGFIVSKNDTIIAHPDRSLHLKPLSSLAIDSENWKKYLNSKTSSEARYFYTPSCRISEDGCWVAIKTSAHSGWKIIIVIARDSLTSEISHLTIIAAVIAITGLLLTLLITTLITHRLTTPLKNLALSTRDIGSGNLDRPLPKAVRNDEIGALSNDFNAMRESLKKHISELQETTAKQQKLESEIQIARDIQMSMIPGAGTADIVDERFQLHALMKPAKTVGGDLYYYQVWEDSLRFIIGDVSDKGVPAALFMAKTVTLFTRALKENLSPGDTLTMMNEILSQNNDACMFVTALCGNIDLLTGNITMANAGHMNPLIKAADGCKEHEVDGATALGLMEGIQYQDICFTLDHKTSLIMYTDGISEAHDCENRQYTDERLLQLVSTGDAEDPGAIGDNIIRSVEKFSEGTEQFDDITLFIIRYE
ncbi:MAG: SpoIIE family protein phosphatase [Proteobacteria bacterium]|nr:SpoIIE family protein phosphatase [Pseudomonadota bacterium]